MSETESYQPAASQVAEVLSDARSAYFDADMHGTWDTYEQQACRYALITNTSIRDAYNVIENGEM
jgi:hypothetical protein